MENTEFVGKLFTLFLFLLQRGIELFLRILAFHILYIRTVSSSNQHRQNNVHEIVSQSNSILYGIISSKLMSCHMTHKEQDIH